MTEGWPLLAFELGLGLLVIGWAAWELWTLRRDRLRRERDAAPPVNRVAEP